MKCPNCDGKAIGFSKWYQGANAFFTRCENCDAELKANAATIGGFVLVCILALVAVFAGLVMYNLSAGSERLWRLAFVVAPVPVGALLTYVFGGYVKKTNEDR